MAEINSISDDAVDAYIAEHIRQYARFEADPRGLVRDCLEKALAAEAWSLKMIIKDALELYADEPMALDVLHYLTQRLQRAGC